MTLRERLESKIIRIPESGCWIWMGTLTREGYAKISVKCRCDLGHRVSYREFKGPIPEGLHLDHLCRVRCCINPAHLEVVTPRENNMRGSGFGAKNAKKTHCPQGHPLSGDNLYVPPVRQRVCRECVRASGRRHRARKKLIKSAKTHEQTA